MHSETQPHRCGYPHMGFSGFWKLCVILGGKLLGFAVSECMFFCHLLQESIVIFRCDSNVNSVGETRYFFIVMLLC